MKQSAKEGKLGHTAIGRFLKNYGGLVIVIIAMMTVTSLYNPVFLNSKNLLQLLINNNTTFFAGLGMTTILRGFAIALNRGYPLPIDPLHPVIAVGNGKLLGIPSVLLIAVLAFVACWFILNKTNIGRDVFAVGGNAEAAKFSGINLAATTIFSFVLSGVFTALAGVIMAARMYSGVPSCATALETDAITAVIIGGTSFTGGDGNIGGTIFGTVLLAVIVNCMVIFGLQEWMQKVITGAIIIAAVLYDRIRHSHAK